MTEDFPRFNEKVLKDLWDWFKQVYEPTCGSFGKEYKRTVRNVFESLVDGGYLTEMPNYPERIMNAKCWPKSMMESPLEIDLIVDHYRPYVKHIVPGSPGVMDSIQTEIHFKCDTYKPEPPPFAVPVPQEDLEPFDDRNLYQQQKRYASAQLVAEALLNDLEKEKSLWSIWDSELADYCEAHDKPFAPWRNT